MTLETINIELPSKLVAKIIELIGDLPTKSGAYPVLVEFVTAANLAVEAAKAKASTIHDDSA